jgi:preprotein translocase subunit SecA
MIEPDESFKSRICNSQLSPEQAQVELQEYLGRAHTLAHDLYMRKHREQMEARAAAALGCKEPPYKMPDVPESANLGARSEFFLKISTGISELAESLTEELWEEFPEIFPVE